MPDICALGAHGTDCQASTLYYLGILNRAAATHLAEIIGEGQGLAQSTMIEWLDEVFPEDAPHVNYTLIDLMDYKNETDPRRNVHNEEKIGQMNDHVMGWLNHILPFNQMGVMAVILHTATRSNKKKI